MPRPRSIMRKIREVLRLTLAEGLSRRRVGAAVGLPCTTVADYVARAQRAGLGWPLPESMDDRDLEARLFMSAAPPVTRPLPDWAEVHRELRRTGVTLQLLHLEYKEGAPDGYQYSQFCRHYRQWQRHLDVVIRQEHRAGEKLFVDFAGKTLPIVNPSTGVITRAQLFVAVLGASNYTYAEVFPSQELPYWIAGHVHSFEYMLGCPRIIVCDNLLSGVKHAHRYEPDINATYLEMAAHYRCAVIPARAAKPRDKAKVEVGVLIAERWILASLRNLTFFSLAEANRAVRQRLEWLNQRPFKKLPGSRQSLLQELERPALRPLPTQTYQYAEWKRATVNVDYHLEVDRHYYSVPYQLVHEHCDVRLTVTTVEVFLRNSAGGQPPTQLSALPPHHRPLAHARLASPAPGVDSGPDPALGRVGGPQHRRAGERDHAVSAPPRTGLSLLGKRYGDDRLEAACRRAVALRSFSYRSVESVLRTGLDRQPLAASAPTPLSHDNVRGPDYYRMEA